jgi:uncharacterized membrane protein YraQ (UPF0718 family)
MAKGGRDGTDWSFWIVAVLSIGGAAAVFLREGREVFVSVLVEDTQLFFEILPKVLAGTLIGALIRLLVSGETIAATLGAGSGWRGLGIATMAGVLIPAGPFTVFPLAAALLAAGADAGAATAFVSAWLLLGLNRAVVWEVPFFGPDFVGLRMLVSAPMPILLGFAARAAFGRFSRKTHDRNSAE